jgi:hypothetical protein
MISFTSKSLHRGKNISVTLIMWAPGLVWSLRLGRKSCFLSGVELRTPCVLFAVGIAPSQVRHALVCKNVGEETPMSVVWETGRMSHSLCMMCRSENSLPLMRIEWRLSSLPGRRLGTL